MQHKFKSKSEFTQNILALMTGTTIAQAIPIAISPILTRIYTPEDFGGLAVFMALVAIFSSISSGRYELAIMLPENDEDAINIFALGFLINIFVFLLVLLVVVFWGDYFLRQMGNAEIGGWLYYVPVSVFFVGMFNLLSYFNNRQKNYKDIAKATVIKSTVQAMVQLTLGFVKSSLGGLVSGQIIAQLFANTRLLKNIISNKFLISKITKSNVISVAKRYKNFPKFSIWGVFLNTLSYQLLNILIPVFYSAATLGFFSIVQRILGIPATIMGSAVAKVFLQEAALEKRLTGKSAEAFSKAIKKLFLIGGAVFGVLFFVIEDIFVFVFGIKWQLAGEYAQILLPFFFIRFVSSSLSGVLIAFEKQKIELGINFILLTVSMSLFFVFTEFVRFLHALTIGLSLSYTVFLYYYYKVSQGEA